MHICLRLIYWRKGSFLNNTSSTMTKTFNEKENQVLL